MVSFKAVIERFSTQGEKTGWTYIKVPADIALKIKPGNKKSFRVKGYLDSFYFEEKALLPMGEGNFIMALKADIRKAIRKRKGDSINVKMAADDKPFTLNADLIKCLADEPEGLSFFNSLTPGHKKYFSNWIESGKTESTRATRIAHTVIAMTKSQDFGAMVRAIRKDRETLLGL